MNPNEQRLEELQAEIEQKKAEIAAIKAEEQQVKADEMTSTEPTEEQMALISGRGLQGNRGDDGSMITEEPVAEPMSMEEAIASLVMKSKRDDDAYKDKGVIGDAARAVGMSRVDFVMSPEFQEVYGNKYDDEAEPLKVKINLDQNQMSEEELDAAAEKVNDANFGKDIDIDERTDEESARQVDMGNPDQDRRMAMEDDIEDRSMGFKADDGGNMSVDEKDDYWKTQEGYDKAIEMYGTKPAWVKEPTMQWNPVEQKYEKISEEDKDEFVDLSVADNIKQLFG